MSLYTFENVSFSYNKKRVLKTRDLTISKGGCLALLGPNGAGKTTLLNLLAFLVLPTSGRIYFQKQPVTRHNQPFFRKKAVLVQQSPVMFSKSVYKNMEFGLRARKVPKVERKKRIEKTLSDLGLTRFAQRPAHRLSGGETQRVAMARALVLAPEVLLCDEPLSMVDKKNRGIILSLLKDIRDNKEITLVLTTHDPGVAEMLADTVVYLNNGQTVDAEEKDSGDAFHHTASSKNAATVLSNH